MSSPASLSSPSAAPQVYGLLLAGGRSTRMGDDKAALRYHGRTQLEWAMSLIEPHVARAFVSVRADQRDDPIRSRFEQIVDRQESLGPITGILAAQERFPDVAWLVVACDLPFLDAGTLEHLLRARAPHRQATAFRSSHDGLPEPLCAVYEPGSQDALQAYVASGKNCPRKFLIRSDALLLDQPRANALDNINTPEELASAMATLREDASTLPKRIKVQYYALLREQAGRSDEAILTRAHSPRELYEELKARYPFSLAPEMLRVAVNADFGEWSQPLADGDSVVFIPPVAGG
jgi:molybdopterin-guanine dinucleotide biosynthesis protein A